MKKSLGKWEQNLLLKQQSLVSKHIPETTLYSENNLNELLNRYQSVYVKHDTSGQGRAIVNIRKSIGGHYFVNGYTIQGKRVKKTFARVNEIKQLLHPFIKLGRESGLYIIQEDIKSFTLNGQPFAIRVHVQKLKGDWVVGGMFATCANTKKGRGTESGIANPYRDAKVVTISEVLSQTVLKNKQEETIKKLKEIAIAASEAVHSVLPRREYGVDFGINQEGKPFIFEVNSTPGIDEFALIENMAIWKRIVEIRRMQNKFMASS
ncbi:YheC/YheD family protein [Sporosarcina thermotolerans]|uniref:YheC/YheD family protein n=1 Tax=Sporosarcina thermotolerans TaxID=633404 RepID=A0AAW9A8G4_9BACL|nr:YheC/YheD family protein [Sporosarcina thermotolerans]MDW0117707.1 YheC/YheD family protein [Sporosarcina thermotolerans]WHT49202.1 YheC/YheD family protein [Sporosarcina thermotolerans]